MSKKSKEIRAPKFKPGDMVFMHMTEEEQDPNFPCPDEVGKVDGAEGWDYDTHEPEEPDLWRNDNIMYIITIPKKFREKGWRTEDPDGMREVHEDQLSYYRPVGHKRS